MIEKQKYMEAANIQTRYEIVYSQLVEVSQNH